MKWEKASILSLARKDSENNKVLDRFCPILPLLPKFIWSCLKPPPPKCSCRFQSHKCNFCTVLTISGFKTKVIYSFSDKGLHLTEVCKIQICVHLCMAQCLWCWVQLFVVHFCGVMLCPCSHAVPVWAGELRMPLWAGSTPESRLCLWGVCVLLPQGHRGCSWLATQVALAALNWFAVKQRGSIHLFCIALGCEPRLGPVRCSCDLREWIFLSFKFGVFETTYMLDVLTVWTQGLYVKFHEDIFIEWKACWEVLDRLGRAEGVTLSAFLPYWFLGTASGVKCSQNCA